MNFVIKNIRKPSLFLALVLFGTGFCTTEAVQTTASKHHKKKGLGKDALAGIGAGAVVVIAASIALAVYLVRLRGVKALSEAGAKSEVIHRAEQDLADAKSDLIAKAKLAGVTLDEATLDSSENVKAKVVQDFVEQRMKPIFERYGFELKENDMAEIEGRRTSLIDVAEAARDKLISKFADTYKIDAGVLKEGATLNLAGKEAGLQFDPAAVGIPKNAKASVEDAIKEIKNLFKKSGKVYVPVDAEEYKEVKLSDADIEKIIFGKEGYIESHGDLSISKDPDFVVVRGSRAALALAGKDFSKILVDASGELEIKIPKYQVVERGIAKGVLPSDVIKGPVRWGGISVARSVKVALVDKLNAEGILSRVKDIDGLVEKVNAAFEKGEAGVNIGTGDDGFSVTRDEDGDYSVGDHDDSFGDSIPLD